MWINPRDVAQWWRPEGFTGARCDMDVRPGGSIRIDMRGPDGKLYPMGGFFQEIVEPEKIIFSSSALDDLGHPLSAVINTVTFAALAGKTRVEIEAHIVRTTEEAEPYLRAMEEGWRERLERLNTYVMRQV
jgi:uncharacterized protein YndB with AHSA1/START domain